MHDVGRSEDQFAAMWRAGPTGSGARIAGGYYRWERILCVVGVIIQYWKSLGRAIGIAPLPHPHKATHTLPTCLGKGHQILLRRFATISDYPGGFFVSRLDSLGSAGGDKVSLSFKQAKRKKDEEVPHSKITTTGLKTAS